MVLWLALFPVLIGLIFVAWQSTEIMPTFDLSQQQKVGGKLP
jgi:hypothetical protein